MTRSPLFYPLNRGMDAEAGGVADLQTDVMRFIAILALCLVAIFALVQSIPLMPTFQAPSKPPTTEPPAEPQLPERILRDALVAEQIVMESEALPLPEKEKPLVITRPTPRRMPLKRTPERIIEQTVVAQAISKPQPKETAAEEEMPAVVEPVQAHSEGFTLRFETDLALTRLVARNEVGLYAITSEKSLRMSVNRGSLSFWPASVPNQFHEMDNGTVPEEVRSALHRAGGINASDVKWGVTLPKVMRGQLDQFLREHNGGSLIIGGDGGLRLEP